MDEHANMNLDEPFFNLYSQSFVRVAVGIPDSSCGRSGIHEIRVRSSRYVWPSFWVVGYSLSLHHAAPEFV